MALRPIVRALVVPVLGLSLSGLNAEAPPVVNINLADPSELRLLPGVGGTLAFRIVQHRKEHGPFRRIEDLMEVSGIGEKFFAGVKRYLVVSGPTTLRHKAS